MTSFVAQHVINIRNFADPFLSDHRYQELMGDTVDRRVLPLIAKGKISVDAMLDLALMSDCLRIAETMVHADQQISKKELDYLLPLLRAISPYLGKAREVYAEYGGSEDSRAMEILDFHRKDKSYFGGRCSKTEWLGAAICRRLSERLGEQSPLVEYEHMLVRLIDELAKIGEATPNEIKETNRLRERLEQEIRKHERSLGTASETHVDARVRVFCSPKAAEVFHSVSHAREVWKRDPFDVSEVHNDARRQMERELEYSMSPRSDFGRIQLVLGDAGSGKTHLMRSFRYYVHSRQLGYVGYLQMSTRTHDYPRYILSNLIDSLEKPYDNPNVSDASLVCLSEALLGHLPASQQTSIDELRYKELFAEQQAELTNDIAENLLRNPVLANFPLDFIRVLLYLQRRDPPIRSRVIKYLRCEELSGRDRRVLGDITPRVAADDPKRMLSHLGQLIYATTGGSLVLLIDQLEDIYHQEDSAQQFRRAMDTIRDLTDQIPHSLIIVACLEDFYISIRDTLTNPVRGRLDFDPEPVRLSGRRSQEEIECLVAKRLEYMYLQADIPFKEQEPLFPFVKQQFEKLANLRTREVLAWCQKFQQNSMTVGEISQQVESTNDAGAPPNSIQTKEQINWVEEWNDFVSQEPMPTWDDDEQREQLFQAIQLAAQQAKQEVNATVSELETPSLVVTHRNKKANILIGLCNKAPQGGGLARQVEELQAHTKKQEQRLILVRSSEYPKGSGSKIAKLLGTIVGAGGRKLIAEDSDWRAIAAFQKFLEKNQSRQGFLAWTVSHQPLASLPLLEQILALPELAAPPAAEQNVVRKTPSIQPFAPPDPITEEVIFSTPKVPSVTLQTPLRVGETKALRPEAVALEPKHLCMHAAFLGSTGSGKTTLALNLVEQLLEQDVPVLLVDRKGDLCRYQDPEFWQETSGVPERDQRKKALRDKLSIAMFTPGNSTGYPLSIPLVPPDLTTLPSHERVLSARYTASALGSMMGLNESKQADGPRLVILTKAIELLAEIATTPPSLVELVELISSQDPDLLNAIGSLDTKYFQRLVDQLETLRLRHGELLSSQGEQLSVEKLLGKGEHAVSGKTQLSIICTKFLSDSNTVDFWVSRLLIELTRFASKNPADGLQAVVMFDEADIYLPAQSKPATKEPMQDLLRRARSAGLGVMLATQSPGDLDYKCRDNIRTWFVGRVAERTAISKMKPLLSECKTDITGKLANSAVGDFFLIGQGNNALREVKTFPSLMHTKQLAEDHILALARQGKNKSLPEVSLDRDVLIEP
jgi:Cdc6-like AAA superfamily ATPase